MIRPRNIDRLRGLGVCARHCALSISSADFQIAIENAVCSPQSKLVRRTKDRRLLISGEMKNPDRDFDPRFKSLPRWCRSGDSPVPFSKGWMTVAAESGFQ